MKSNSLALLVTLLVFSLAGASWAQAPGVPIVRQGQGSVPEPDLIKQAGKLREADQLLSLVKIKRQKGRTSCRLDLPPLQSQPMSGSQLWSLARKSHVRIGYLYLCPKCKKQHLSLAGGYALTSDGAVATCYHVVIEPEYCTQGHLAAVTNAGEVVPVTQILACDKSADICIVRIHSATPLEPLPLNVNISPGDDVWCYSDPRGHTGFFSHGMVNRFYQNWDFAAAKPKSPRRMNVSTDWAPGSSGSAVLDRFGNAVGHVCRISAQGINPSPETTTSTNHTAQTAIVFHEAACAADVRALIKR
jgi:hypothetical protein